MQSPKQPRETYPAILRSGAWRLFLLLACLPLTRGFSESPSRSAEIGVPFNRSYSLDEIGVSRGARLSFDPIGRLAVFQGNKYVVLNDSNWINLFDENDEIENLEGLATDDSGHTYFGALANWGAFEWQADGTLTSESFRPENAPDWVYSNNFYFVIPRPDGIYFGGQNGIVYRDRASKNQTFIEAPDTASIFYFKGKLYVSTHNLGCGYLDLKSRSVIPLGPNGEASVVIDQMADTGGPDAIISTTGSRIALFDGEKTKVWDTPLGTYQPAQISRLLSLSNGTVAVAIDGKGVYLISKSGECLLALTTPEYRNINDLASNEPGVLWIATEFDVQKLLYDDPVTIIDQRSGLSANWPQVLEWKGKTIVLSNGTLFEIVPDANDLSHHFEALPVQPPLGAMAVAPIGDQLLIGNGLGIWALKDSNLQHVIEDMEVNRLVEVDENRCFALARTEIALLQWDGSSWTEAAPRIEGIGFPFISLATEHAAWIELGVNRVARLSFRDGKIDAQVFDDLPWKQANWVPVGIVDDIVVLGGAERQFFFYDESKEQFTDAPELARILKEAPMPASRYTKVEDGKIWAGYEHGIFSIEYDEHGASYDQETYKTIRDSFPFIKLTGEKDRWIYTGTTLYHIDPDHTKREARPLQPLLVSMSNQVTNEPIYSVFDPDPMPEKVPFSQNSLNFLFFASGYSSSRTPRYEFTVSNRNNEWSIPSNGSAFTLANLQEGDYRLSIQMYDAALPLGKPLLSSFSISPPWYRSLTAYILYWLLGAATLLSSMAITYRRSKRRQAYLETLVHERTEELRTTMEKLNEKERNAAILDERNRLASEIHDSVQQGLSGLALQLDATLKLPNLANAIQSRLTVARRMVTFTRHEVQQAIWDLESPFLENDDLADALQKMAEFISVDSTLIQLEVESIPQRLDSIAKHNLLRIVQEAITNAIRHGKAELISVKITRTEETINLSISDNGCGFDSQEVLSSGISHFGIRGMKARVSKINGTIEIDSKAGFGTTINVHVPLPQNFT